MFNRKAVFLDRDGTLIEIIERPEHPKKRTAPFVDSELKFFPDAWDALDRLRVAGFLTIMVTNQPDVAHGYMSEDEWQKIHKTVVDTLFLDDFYMCRHRSEDHCPFKKPFPLMLQSAADKWGINLSESYMIGDTDTDMKAGKAAGCTTIILNRPYNQGIGADARVLNLTDAVITIKIMEISACSAKAL